MATIKFTIKTDSEFNSAVNELHKVCASLDNCTIRGHHSPYLTERLSQLQDAIREYSKKFKPVVIPPNPQLN